MKYWRFYSPSNFKSNQKNISGDMSYRAILSNLKNIVISINSNTAVLCSSKVKEFNISEVKSLPRRMYQHDVSDLLVRFIPDQWSYLSEQEKISFIDEISERARSITSKKPSIIRYIFLSVYLGIDFENDLTRHNLLRSMQWKDNRIHPLIPLRRLVMHIDQALARGLFIPRSSIPKFYQNRQDKHEEMSFLSVFKSSQKSERKY